MTGSAALAVENALAASTNERAQRLLALTENQWLDRKSIRTQAKKLATDVCAFANAEGGTLIIGLRDGVVEGCDSDPVQVNELRQASIDFVIPPVRVECSDIACIRDDGAPDHLLVISVPSGHTVHSTQDDSVYLRVGDETRKLSFAQRQELLYDKGQAHFDGTPVSGLDRSALSADLLDDFAARLGVQDVAHTLRGLGLVTREGAITAAAYLMFGDTPQDEFPEAYVRVLRYNGTERGTGVRQELSADVRCTGPIPTVLDQARETVRRVQPVRRALASSGRFETVGLIPEDAWLEGIVNAVVHRSYSIAGDHIRIEIFDDRIDIHSPGRFAGIAHPIGDPRKIVRFARNPRIARACSALDYGQELGEGIRRIFEEMRLANLVDPLYRETAAGVLLRLQAIHVDGEVMARLPRQAGVVMGLLRTGGRSTGDIADYLSRSRPWTIRMMKQMQEAGLVDWVGKTANDPRAYWRIHSE